MIHWLAMVQQSIRNTLLVVSHSHWYLAFSLFI